VGTIVADQIAGTRIDMTVVSQPSPTGEHGVVTALPDSADWVHEWQEFWVEIWVSVADPALAIAEATVDLQYATEYLTAAAIEHGPAFAVNPTGVIDDTLGVVSTLGGETQVSGLGQEGPVLLARVRFVSTEDDQVPVDKANRNIGPYDMRLALASGHTRLADESVVLPALGGSPGTELWAVPYDIDDTNQIDFGDLSYFAAAFGGRCWTRVAEPPYVWWADFDKSGRVDFGDSGVLRPEFRQEPRAGPSGRADVDLPEQFSGRLAILDRAVAVGEGEAIGRRFGAPTVFCRLVACWRALMVRSKAMDR
jgi:hypothetical protein